MEYDYASVNTELSNANTVFTNSFAYSLHYSGGSSKGDSLILIATPK